MSRILSNRLLNRTRELRKSQTPWESKLWSHLRTHRFLDLQFKRQVQIGKYIVDFCCRSKKLIIELDGGQHNQSEGIKKDYYRDKFLRSEGYRVLRFWNSEIDINLEGVLEKIRVEVVKS